MIKAGSHLDMKIRAGACCKANSGPLLSYEKVLTPTPLWQGVYW